MPLEATRHDAPAAPEIAHADSAVAGGVIAVVVAYAPRAEGLHALLMRLGPQVRQIVLVDNADAATARQTIAGLARQAVGCPIDYLPIGSNSGIAHAQNRGVARAIELGARWALLSDDDSLPAEDMVAALVSAISRPDAVSVAAVGAWVEDDRTHSAALVYRDTWLGPRRMARADLALPDTRVAFLVASGCLLNLKLWASIGPMREDFFIDHVDLEWCLRARQAGYSIDVVPAARLGHRLGDRLIRPWLLRRRPVHLHAPARNYYLARNTIRLVLGPLLPAGWRLGYLIWLAKYCAFQSLFVAPRLTRTRLMVKGLADGLRGIGGPLRDRPRTGS